MNVMKHILVLVFLTVYGYFTPFAQPQQNQYEKPTVIRKDRVVTIPKEWVGKQPTWNDDRIKTLEGRQAIVLEAWQKVQQLLIRCNEDVGVAWLLCIGPLGNNEDCICKANGLYMRGKVIFMFDSENRPADFAKTNLYIKYAQVPSEDKINAINRLSGDYNNETISGPGFEHLIKENETFDSNIEIFPEVFESGSVFGFYMESERYSQEGPFAPTPTDAVTFLLLHEIGHLEYYISRQKKGAHLKESDIFNRHAAMGLEEEEKFCDKFASTLWRCL